MPVADNTGLGIRILAIGHQLPGEFAFGIVGASDKGAELAKPQAKTAAFAVRTASHQRAIIILLEKMRAKLLVQHVDHIGDCQLCGAVDGCLEVTPEACQQCLPVELAVRHLVELVFQLCGEVIFDIAREEIVEESDNQPAPVLGNEFATVLDHIGAVLKHLDDRGVG